MVVAVLHRVPVAHRRVTGRRYHAVGHQRRRGGEDRRAKVCGDARFRDPCVAAGL